MAIDMYEHRFRQEIGRNPAFVMPTANDPAVWREGFPAWRALFTSMLHWGHSTGYRVPDFASFCRYVENAYAVIHPDRDRYRRYFEPPLREAMRRRMGVWYNSGMAEHHIYLALVQAIEDANPKVGLVFYDARLDWKMKCDAYVVCRGLQFKINIYRSEEKDRPKVEQEREETEYARKRNTSESSHWCNDQADAAVDVSLSPRGASDIVDVNGVKLFSHAAINRLLGEIYAQSGVYDGFLFGPKAKNASHHLDALASP